MTRSSPAPPSSVPSTPLKRKGDDDLAMMEGTTGSNDMADQSGTSQISNFSGGSVPPLSSSTSAAMMRKAEEINLVLMQPEVDLWRLRELALSEGGLVNGELFVCFDFLVIVFPPTFMDLTRFLNKHYRYAAETCLAEIGGARLQSRAYCSASKRQSITRAYTRTNCRSPMFNTGHTSKIVSGTTI